MCVPYRIGDFVKAAAPAIGWLGWYAVRIGIGIN